MKILPNALLVAGLLALSACGGAAEENTATANVATEDLYNVAPDDLGTDLLANDTLGNAPLGNELGFDNTSVTNGVGETNTTETAVNSQ